MTIATPLCLKLKHSVTSQATEIAVNEDIAAVCACLNQPSHMIGTIYTISQSEKILIHGCKDGKLLLQRGFEGSKTCAFPSGACIKINEVIAGKVCDSDVLDDSCPDIWARLTVGKGLTLNRDDPDNPLLEIAATGVAAMNMCGAEINTCGQFTYVPPNWPASCLPVFDPCCSPSGGGGGSGSVDACNVSFSPPFGSTILTQDTVCGALEDLQNAIMDAGSGGQGITSLTAGQCITLGGTSVAPVVSVTSSGVAPGTYNGFTVNQCGQVTGYSEPIVDPIPMAGVAPITAEYVAGTGYVVSIAEATIEDCGCVRLADEGDITTPPNLTTMPGESVVTVAFLDAWAMAKGL